MRKLLVAFAAIVVALVAIWRLFFRKPEELDWERIPKPGRLVDLDGETIHYIDEGSGPPVLLVHGFGGQTYSYRHLISDLSPDHRVVALDLLGFGYSERVRDGDYSPQAQARRVLALMDALGIRKAAVVGHSMGGGIAMRVASTEPERVDRLALVASVSGDRIRTLPVTPLLRLFLPLFSRLFGRRMLRASFHDKSLLTEDIWEEYHRPALIRGSTDGLYNIMKHARKGPPIDFSRITQPVLLLEASDEKIVPRGMSARLRERFPRAQVEVIPDVGHVLLEERPAECNAVIRRFLDAGRVDLPREAPGAVDAPVGAG